MTLACSGLFRYRLKFPELESLVLHPIDYARVVKRIGNEMDLTLVDLEGLLPSATIMVVSVTASTTTGKPLSEENLERVMDACERALGLDDAKRKMLEFVEGRMGSIAPNLSAIVGSAVAAQLMGTAGMPDPPYVPKRPPCHGPSAERWHKALFMCTREKSIAPVSDLAVLTLKSLGCVYCFCFCSCCTGSNLRWSPGTGQHALLQRAFFGYQAEDTCGVLHRNVPPPHRICLPHGDRPKHPTASQSQGLAPRRRQVHPRGTHGCHPGRPHRWVSCSNLLQEQKQSMLE